jgi:hypothetical protein
MDCRLLGIAILPLLLLLPLTSIEDAELQVRQLRMLLVRPSILIVLPISKVRESITRPLFGSSAVPFVIIIFFILVVVVVVLLLVIQ